MGYLEAEQHNENDEWDDRHREEIMKRNSYCPNCNTYYCLENYLDKNWYRRCRICRKIFDYMGREL